MSSLAAPESQASAARQLSNPAAGAFSSEQTHYLEGFFTALTQRMPFVAHTPTGQITSDPESGLPNAAAPVDTFHGTPVEDLCREERWKFEENPLDIWDKLLAHAHENRVPAPEDIFRFKFHGLFYVAPAQDSFMLRLRVPGAALKSYQLLGVAEMAEDWGCGRADVTTRANLQLREFQPRDIVRVLNKLQRLGLTSRGSGADNLRNITAPPITGLDPEELLDVLPYAEAMNNYILNSRDLYGLPRKFNIAFDNGGSISVVADTNDIGFMAVRVNEGKQLPPGIYFRVVLCGITGHRQFASDCGILIHPEQAVAVAAAMVRVFAENGDRTNRKKARLKYLIDRWGVERFLGETQRRLTFPLIHFPESDCEPRKAINRTAHIGVHPQSQPGLRYIGISVPVGKLPAEQMRAVANIADEFGSGDLRLTVWQNIIVPNIPAERVAEAEQALLAAGLKTSVGTALAGTVACTGNKGCRYAATDTKTHAVALATHIDEHFRVLQPMNLHLTGCPHSCAQHYIGDIGLLGTKVNGEEGYQVSLGGGSDQDQGLARELIPAIRFTDLPPIMDNLFAAFEQNRADEHETFLSFTRRHSIEQLRSFAQPTAKEIN